MYWGDPQAYAFCAGTEGRHCPPEPPGWRYTGNVNYPCTNPYISQGTFTAEEAWAIYFGGLSMAQARQTAYHGGTASFPELLVGGFAAATGAALAEIAIGLFLTSSPSNFLTGAYLAGWFGDNDDSCLSFSPLLLIGANPAIGAGKALPRALGKALPYVLPIAYALVWALSGSNDDDTNYYFRGTTEGFPGSPAMLRVGLTSTSTQPGVATIFATVAETEYGGHGIVYIASSEDMTGVAFGEANVLGALEYEVTFQILPLEFAQRAGEQVSAAGARQILASMGRPVSSIIRTLNQNFELSSLIPLSKAEISDFVQQARAMP